MRAVQATTYRSLQSYLDKASERMSKLQIETATGKRLNRASDDPTAIHPALDARSQVTISERYIDTIDSGLHRVDNMDSQFEHIENILQRVREIAISAVNGSLGSEVLQTYADEVGQLKAELIDTANAQVDGKYLFAGYQTTTKPFAANPAYDPLTYDPTIYDPIGNPPPVLYQGDAGQMNLEIAPGELVRVGVDGGTFFLGLEDINADGAYDNSDNVVGTDLFHQLTLLEADLRANDQTAVSTRLNSFDPAIEQARRERSMIGHVGNRLETARSQMEDVKIDMEAMRSRYEDADIVETITNLQLQQQAFQAALNVTGQVSELSILDYLR